MSQQLELFAEFAEPPAVTAPEPIKKPWFDNLGRRGDTLSFALRHGYWEHQETAEQRKRRLKAGGASK